MQFQPQANFRGPEDLACNWYVRTGGFAASVLNFVHFAPIDGNDATKMLVPTHNTNMFRTRRRGKFNNNCTIECPILLSLRSSMPLYFSIISVLPGDQLISRPNSLKVLTSILSMELRALSSLAGLLAMRTRASSSTYVASRTFWLAGLDSCTPGVGSALLHNESDFIFVHQLVALGKCYGIHRVKNDSSKGASLPTSPGG